MSSDGLHFLRLLLNAQYKMGIVVYNEQLAVHLKKQRNNAVGAS